MSREGQHLLGTVYGAMLDKNPNKVVIIAIIEISYCRIDKRLSYANVLG